MDNVFEQSKEADPFGKANSQKLTNAINKFDAEVFDGRKIIHEACDFIFNQFIKTEGEAQQPRVIGARQSFVGQIDYSSVHDFLDSQLSQLQDVLESTDLKIVDKKLDEFELQRGQDQIQQIDGMYKKITSLVSGMEKTIKQSVETQKVSEDLK